MVDLSKLSKPELSAAMRGGTTDWGAHGSALNHVRYSLAIEKQDRRRRKCHCGCGKRSTHRGFANGVCLMSGCEMAVARWVRDPRAALRNVKDTEHG